MKKIDKKILSGEDLYYYYTHNDPEYAQVIETAMGIIGLRVFDMLKTADGQGKRIVLKESVRGAIDPPLDISVE